MPEIPNSVPVSGFIAPLDDLDQYPSHDARYGKGGLRTVATTAERDAITTERREAGMRVYVTADGIDYQLGDDLLTWTLATKVLSVKTVADLRANSATVLDGTQAITVSTGVNAGAARHYWFNPADTSTPDDGSTVIVDGSGQRWYLLTEAFELSISATLDIRNLTADNFVRPLKTVSSTCYETSGDGGGNRFYYDNNDPTSADNGGSIIVDAAGRRWKVVGQSATNLLQWGVDRTGTNDCTAKIQAAADWCAANDIILAIPAGDFRIDSTVNFLCHVSASPGARFLTANSITMVRIGNFGAGTAELRVVQLRLPQCECSVTNHSVDSCAVEIGRCNACWIWIPQTMRTTYGVRMRPENKQCVYNHIWLGYHWNHKVGIQIKPGPGAWGNENIWYNGEIQTASANVSGTGPYEPGYYAIQLLGNDDSTFLTDNNLFLKPSLEGDIWEAALYFIRAQANRILHCRSERGDLQANKFWFEGGSSAQPCVNNTIEVGFASTEPIILNKNTFAYSNQYRSRGANGWTGFTDYNASPNLPMIAFHNGFGDQGNLLAGYRAIDPPTNNLGAWVWGISPGNGFRTKQFGDVNPRATLNNSPALFLDPGSGSAGTRFAIDANNNLQITTPGNSVGLGAAPNSGSDAINATGTSTGHRWLKNINSTAAAGSTAGLWLQNGTPHGAFIMHNQSSTSGYANRFIWRSFDNSCAGFTIVCMYAGQTIDFQTGGSVTKLQINDYVANDQTTALSIRVNGVLAPVSVGAADSAGAGFRQLRIPN